MDLRSRARLLRGQLLRRYRHVPQLRPTAESLCLQLERPMLLAALRRRPLLRRREHRTRTAGHVRRRSLLRGHDVLRRLVSAVLRAVTALPVQIPERLLPALPMQSELGHVRVATRVASRRSTTREAR